VEVNEGLSPFLQTEPKTPITLQAPASVKSTEPPNSTNEADEEEDEKTDDEWYYKDSDGAIQGPYSGEQMLAWYQDGFLTPDALMVAKNINPKDPNCDDQFSLLIEHLKDLQQRAQPEREVKGVAAAKSKDKEDLWYAKDPKGTLMGPCNTQTLAFWLTKGQIQSNDLAANTSEINSSNIWLPIQTWIQQGKLLQVRADSKAKEKKNVKKQAEKPKEKNRTKPPPVRWYFKDKDKIQGSYSTEQIRDYYEVELVTKHTLVGRNTNDPKNFISLDRLVMDGKSFLNASEIANFKNKKKKPLPKKKLNQKRKN